MKWIDSTDTDNLGIQTLLGHQVLSKANRHYKMLSKHFLAKCQTSRETSADVEIGPTLYFVQIACHFSFWVITNKMIRQLCGVNSCKIYNFTRFHTFFLLFEKILIDEQKFKVDVSNFRLPFCSRHPTTFSS